MRYYFDIFDGSIWARDDFGIDCRDNDGARYQAVMALTEMAREQLPHSGNFARYRVRVRSTGGSRFIVKLDFIIVGEGTD